MKTLVQDILTRGSLSTVDYKYNIVFNLSYVNCSKTPLLFVPGVATSLYHIVTDVSGHGKWPL